MYYSLQLPRNKSLNDIYFMVHSRLKSQHTTSKAKQF
jgi:hypothetical protein